jgi:predicted RNase H-like HicB family nuclease
VRTCLAVRWRRFGGRRDSSTARDSRNPHQRNDTGEPRRKANAVHEYAVIYERGNSGWGAWVPDLPGCVAAGESREEVERLIREAIEAHLESLRAHGEPVPEPSSIAGAVDVS